MNGVRERRKSGKGQLKEKVVQIYENFFLGQDITEGRTAFWDDFFLLKVNVKSLNVHFEKLTVDELICLKPHLNRLFAKCVETVKQENPYRIANAIQTLNCVITGVLNCKRGGGTSADLVHIMMGAENADTLMQDLITVCNHFLGENQPCRLKCLVLNLLLSIVCANSIINENPLMDFLTMDEIFESLMMILSSVQLRQTHGKDACHLLALLMQYRKFESNNPYRLKLSVLDNELVLNGFSYVISLSLAEYNSQYRQRTAEPQGFFSSLSNIIGNVLVGAEEKVANIKAQDALLLALYEAVHVNRNFITTLTYAHTTASSPTPTPTLATSSQTPGTPPSPPSEAGDQGSPQLVAMPTAEPTNLLVVFLEYCSIIVQDVRDPDRLNSSRLCFLILLCISEDQYASSLLHDVHMNFKVCLHKIPMRHRKLPPEKNMKSRPLACWLLDLMVEFLQSHLMKTLPVDLFNLCLGVIHRLLCYQKRNKLRVEYEWKILWTALFNLMRFVHSIEQQLSKVSNIFVILLKAVSVFNLFITFGDAFLPSPDAYDALYYEIIRMHSLFDNLYTLALRYTSGQDEFKEKAHKLIVQLSNIRAIIHHFTPKIDAWSVTNNQSALTEDQVLCLVRSNYDSLTLKLQDDLDHYGRYIENTPAEKSFFSTMVRSIVSKLRKECIDASIDMQTHLHELSSIA